MKEGQIAPGIFSDGVVIFVTCHCGNEQGDMGKNVVCEECGEGPMRTAENLDEAIREEWGLDD